MDVYTNIQDNVVAVLRITNNEGYLSYLYGDSNDEVEYGGDFSDFADWAADVCDMTGAMLIMF